MDEKLRQLLDQMPERPPRSKLEPHAEVIRELRKKRRTYGEIATFFREHLQLSVAPSTIHDFVKTRARQARQSAASDPELPVSSSAEVRTESVSKPPSEITASGVSDDVRNRIRALKAQPSPAKPERPRFEFNPQEALTFHPKPKEK